MAARTTVSPGPFVLTPPAAFAFRLQQGRVICSSVMVLVAYDRGRGTCLILGESSADSDSHGHIRQHPIRNLMLRGREGTLHRYGQGKPRPEPTDYFEVNLRCWLRENAQMLAG